MLSAYQRQAYRLFGKYAHKVVPQNPRLRSSLLRAHINLRPEVYVSTSYLNMFLSFVVSGLLIFALAVAAASGFVGVAATTFILLAPMPIVLSGTIYLLTFVLPDIKASGRVKDLDAKLPFALNYIATMAAAGIPLDRILASLAQKSVYGEVANEAAWIHRDLTYLGMDIVTALNLAVDRTPSRRFQDLLQGIIVTQTAGGNLKSYFRAKAEQFAYENRQEQKSFLETLGVMSESFVTVVVAAPLFLLVLLSVMTMFGGSAENMLFLGYVLILAVLPLAQAAFVLTIKSMAREG